MFSDKRTNYSCYLPLILLSFTFVMFLLFQACLQMQDTKRLNSAIEERTKMVKESEEYRQITSSILRDLIALSANGNKNAESVISILKQEGLNFQTAQSPSVTDTSDSAAIPETVDESPAPDKENE